MIRNLTIVAVASFVLALGCIGGAFALGGRDLIQHGWNLPMDGWSVDTDDDNDVRVRFHSDDALSPTEREEIANNVAWAGGEALRIDVPATVTYRQSAPGAESTIRIAGPRRLVDRVVVDGDRIRLKDENGHRVVFFSRGHDRLRIEVTAPAVRRFTLNGSGELSVQDYDQPSLAVELNGSGDVAAEGKTAALDLRISGSGDADLESLDAGDATVEVAGSGSATIAPHGAAKVRVAGSGQVDLATQPTSLDSDIAGSGDVNQNW